MVQSKSDRDFKLEATDWKNGKVEIILQMFTRKQDLTSIWFLWNTILILVSSVIILLFLKKLKLNSYNYCKNLLCLEILGSDFGVTIIVT